MFRPVPHDPKTSWIVWDFEHHRRSLSVSFPSRAKGFGSNFGSKAARLFLCAAWLLEGLKPPAKRGWTSGGSRENRFMLTGRPGREAAICGSSAYGTDHGAGRGCDNGHCGGEGGTDMSERAASNKQSRWGESPKYSLTELEAYDAMLAFLDAYWRRGGPTSDDIAVLCGSISRDVWVNGQPLDIAQWGDWLAAIETVKARRGISN